MRWTLVVWREFSDLGDDPALLKALEARVAADAASFDHCSRAVLCHNDFHEGNVLVAEKSSGWMVTWFIDVDNAIAVDPLVELAKTDYYSIRDDLVNENLRLYHALELWDWFAS